MNFFLNVDTQVDFMLPEGKLYVNGAVDIIPNLKVLSIMLKNEFVVSTADSHEEVCHEFSNTPDFVNTFPPHCIKGTEGAEFIPETKFASHIVDWREDGYELIGNKITILKNEFSVFAGNKHFDEILETIRNQGYNTVTVFGVSGEICVGQAVDGLLDRDFKVNLIENCVASINPTNFTLTLERWKLNPNFNLVNI